MNKFLSLIIIVVSACLFAGLYGIIHDQITYSIAPEYYTKFKFYQFGLADQGDEASFPNPRIQVSIVGFMATWWMGIPIGVILGLVGLIHSSWKVMVETTLKAFGITMLLAFLTGLIRNGSWDTNHGGSHLWRLARYISGSPPSIIGNFCCSLKSTKK